MEDSRVCGSNRSVTGHVNLSGFGTFVVLVSLSITMHPIRFDGDSCLRPGSLQVFPPSVGFSREARGIDRADCDLRFYFLVKESVSLFNYVTGLQIALSILFHWALSEMAQPKRSLEIISSSSSFYKWKKQA